MRCWANRLMSNGRRAWRHSGSRTDTSSTEPRSMVRNGPRSAIKDLREFAHVYVNGILAATLDRLLGQDTATIPVPDGHERLDILVENGGRVNFKKVPRTERKGITRSVTLGNREIARVGMSSRSR